MIHISETISPTMKRSVKVAPSDLSQIGIVMKYDILKHVRSKRLVGILAIVTLVLLIFTELPPLLGDSYPDDANEFVNTYASFANLLIIIGATLFAGDAIVSEFQNRTGLLLFPKPVKRWVLLAGKFLASMAAVFLVLLLYYGAALLLGLAITGSFSTLGVESLLLAMLYAITALSLGFLVSSIMKGIAGAQILTFALFIFIFSIMTQVFTLGDVEPWFMVTYSSGAISYITEDPYPTGGTVEVPGTSATSTYIPDVGVAMAVMAAYALVSLTLAYYFFNRREMSA